MDLSATFDTVDHDTLFLILNHKFRVEDKALIWFDQYLSTSVTINGQERNLDVSVP